MSITMPSSAMRAAVGRMTLTARRNADSPIRGPSHEAADVADRGRPDNGPRLLVQDAPEVAGSSVARIRIAVEGTVDHGAIA